MSRPRVSAPARSIASQACTEASPPTTTGMPAERTRAGRSVSSVISQLGETPGGRGWIQQSYDPSDRRVRRLSLSRKGKAVHRQLMQDLQSFSAELQPA